MPELPEVEALAAFLRERAVGSVVAAVEIGTISVLKTYDPQPSALRGLEVTAVDRHGKCVDLDVDGLHLVFHLSKAGWLRWYDAGARRWSSRARARSRCGCGSRRCPRTRPTSGPAAVPGFDLTEAGTKKRLAVHIVR